MRRCLPILVMLTGVTLLGSDPAAAYGYGEAPWCAIYSVGRSSQERCEFRDFESCRQEITGGNRGFCNHNPRWTGQPKRWDLQLVQNYVYPRATFGEEPMATWLKANEDELIRIFPEKDINVVVVGGEANGYWRIMGAKYRKTISVDAWR